MSRFFRFLGQPRALLLLAVWPTAAILAARAIWWVSKVVFEFVGMSESLAEACAVVSWMVAATSMFGWLALQAEREIYRR